MRPPECVAAVTRSSFGVDVSRLVSPLRRDRRKTHRLDQRRDNGFGPGDLYMPPLKNGTLLRMTNDWPGWIA